jgi:hypothetical protein
VSGVPAPRPSAPGPHRLLGDEARRAAIVAAGSRLFLVLIALVTTYTIGVRERALYLRDPAHAEALHGFLGRLLGPWAHWDGVWFVRIAADGYKAHPHSEAFFPLYPLLVRVVAAGAGDYVVAGLIVSLACYAGAMVVLFKLARAELGPRVALWSVALISISPTALFFQAVYSESLFLLLTLLTFWWARRGRWALAGLAGLLAVLTRSSGLLLILPLAVMWWEQRHGRCVRLPGGPPSGPTSGPPSDVRLEPPHASDAVSSARSGRARPDDSGLPVSSPSGSAVTVVSGAGAAVTVDAGAPAVSVEAGATAAQAGVATAGRPGRHTWLWILLVPTGLVLYMAYLWVVFRRALLFSSVQTAWGRELTLPTTAIGRGTVAAVRAVSWLVVHGSSAVLGSHTASGGLQSDGVANLLEFIGLVAAVAMLAACWRKLPAAWTLYALAALLFPLLYSTEARPLYSLPRFVLVVFPLFVGAAAVLAPRPVWRWLVCALFLALLVASTLLFASFI